LRYSTSPGHALHFESKFSDHKNLVHIWQFTSLKEAHTNLTGLQQHSPYGKCDGRKGQC